ncbi:MAG: replicative DNA helicase [Dongiaceae bacterium]
MSITGTSVAVLRAGGNEAVPYRTPPHNFEAEQALLGALMVNNRAYEKVSEYLIAEHFADPVHGRIFDAIAKLIERGQIANPVTLKPFFENDPALNNVGGAQYLSKLAAAVVSVVNTDDYGRLVYDLFLRRQLIDIGERVVNDAYDPKVDRDARNQIESTEQRLFELATTGYVDGGFQTFEQTLTKAMDLAGAAFKRDGQLGGVATGFIDMDSKLGGLFKSDLIILAGRPSMGKTALATNIAFNVAKRCHDDQKANGDAAVDKGVVAFFSLEMSAEQLATRIIAEQADIPSERIRRGDLSHEEFAKVAGAAHALMRVPLYIDDTPALSISALRTRARRLARTHGLRMIVVDYLQLLTAAAGASSENRVQELSAITRGIKAIAKELDVPVIALSQLSRQVEQRDDKRPQLSDLRESGSIEQDADVVMFVYREEYYRQREEPSPRGDETPGEFDERYNKWRQTMETIANQAEVIIGKQRHGPIGKVLLFFDGSTTKFDNYAQNQQLPARHS